MKIEEFAQMNILCTNIDTTINTVTIDLGTIYIVPYETELEFESHSIPTLKRNMKYEKHSINEVDSTFNLQGIIMV